MVEEHFGEQTDKREFKKIIDIENPKSKRPFMIPNSLKEVKEENSQYEESVEDSKQ